MSVRIIKFIKRLCGCRSRICHVHKFQRVFYIQIAILFYWKHLVFVTVFLSLLCGFLLSPSFMVFLFSFVLLASIFMSLRSLRYLKSPSIVLKWLYHKNCLFVCRYQSSWCFCLLSYFMISTLSGNVSLQLLWLISTLLHHILVYGPCLVPICRTAFYKGFVYLSLLSLRFSWLDARVLSLFHHSGFVTVCYCRSHQVEI